VIYQKCRRSSWKLSATPFHRRPGPRHRERDPSLPGAATPTMFAAFASSSLPRASVRHSASLRSRRNALVAARLMKWRLEQI